jgi:hypothetical protein
MATLDMAAIHLAATDLANHPLTSADGISPVQQPVGVTLVPPIMPPPLEGGLDEPSSLALALIGVATLAAYRALLHQVVGRSASTPAQQPLVKPRRRAA